VTLGVEPLRRIAAYAVCADPADRVLLVRGSAGSGTPGVWSLPGGAVDHGEHPGDTVVRETAAEAQRFAAYAVATDPAGRLLLTEVAAGFPGAGRWHLPGGGTDFGEQPPAALLRELAEETGQRGQVEGLLGVASHRDAASLGPEGYPIDWGGVRASYRVRVDHPDRPRVTEWGGSTARARWFRPDALAGLPLTEAAVEALGVAGRRGPGEL
jgi:ADP-ribose pyrophosphatase YjhB (NUDIX family)